MGTTFSSSAYYSASFSIPFPFPECQIAPISNQYLHANQPMGKKPRPTALWDCKQHLDRVAHFVRNPALPTDQPLLGRWANGMNINIGCYKFDVIPNSYIICVIGMRCHTFQARRRYKKMQFIPTATQQITLHPSHVYRLLYVCWHPKLIYNMCDRNEIPYVLGKAKIQEDAFIPIVMWQIAQRH